MRLFEYIIHMTAGGAGGGGSSLWNGLQAYYTADNTPNDALGTYNGTLTNGATYGTGIINQGFDLDGVNDYVDLGNNLDFDGSTPFSISCWVYFDSSTDQSMFAKFTVTQGYQLIRRSTRDVRFALYALNVGGGYISVRTTSTINSLNWHNVIVTYDGSKDSSGVNIYFNGSAQTLFVEANTLTGSISNSANAKIGSRNSDFYLNGVQDEIGVWNRELTSTEVTELYNSGAGKQYPN